MQLVNTTKLRVRVHKCFLKLSTARIAKKKGKNQRNFSGNVCDNTLWRNTFLRTKGTTIPVVSEDMHEDIQG